MAKDVTAAPSKWSLTNEQITTCSGSVSGFAATFAKQPIQRIKWIRQVDAGVAVPYRELLRRTIQSDGLTGLFRGSVAGIMRNVPHSALVYTLYPIFEPIVLRQQRSGYLPGKPSSSGGGSGGGGEGSSSSSGGGSGSAAKTSPPATGKVEFSTRFWAGYATLFFATLITHPLDTLRVRISVMQGEASTPAMIKSIIDTGGWRALYQGFGATLVGAGPRGALGFGVFETLKDGNAHLQRPPATPTALAHRKSPPHAPTTNAQVQEESGHGARSPARVYPPSQPSIALIASDPSTRRLHVLPAPRVLRSVSSQSPTMNSLSPTTRKLLFGYLAGLCAETAIYPLDTVRRRQQAFGAASPLGRHNVFRALVMVWQHEGLMGMFKGLSLNLFKNPIATAVSFSVNDLVKDALKNRRAASA